MAVHLLSHPPLHDSCLSSSSSFQFSSHSSALPSVSNLAFPTRRVKQVGDLHHATVRLPRQTALTFASLAAEPSVVPPSSSQKAGKVIRSWQWNFGGESIPINYASYTSPASASEDGLTVLLLPAFSDVSTVDEWDAVALQLASSDGPALHQVLALDWPGFGSSGRPALTYDADIMENFLVDFISSVLGEERKLVLVGAGHSATAAVRATSKDLIQPRAISAVAPTWAGPLAIVFGNEEKMKFRYSLYRNTIRTPAVGWAIYNYLLTNKENMRMQYLTHVYADPDNVTPSLIESRLALTKLEGARYGPASFVSGLLDSVASREEWLQIFSDITEQKGLPVQVVVSSRSPRRSRAEMEALKGVKGLRDYSIVDGALLPHEEFPQQVADVLAPFLSSL